MMMNFKNKKILVTGGAGFIGSHLVDALVKLGADVVVVDNLSTGKRENVNPAVKFYEGDICSAGLTEIFQGEKPQIVYNLASNTNVPRSVRDPLYDFRSLSGALNVIDHCRLQGIEKLIFTSSGFIYGNTKSRPIKESEVFKPISPYGISKKTVEYYLQFYRDVYQLNYLVFRFATVYGPRQTKGAMADYIDKLAHDLQAEMYGDGTKTRDYVFVKDIIDLLVSPVIFSVDEKDPIFNIGSGKETTLNELYANIAHLLGKKPAPIYMPDRPGELNGYSLDATKAKDVLHWQPRVSLAEGLKITMQASGVL